MDEARDSIRAAGGDVVAVFQYRAAPARNFCRQRGVELDCFGDPDRAAYRQVGLERGKLRESVGIQLVPGWTRAIARGATPGIPSGDVHQRPGTFVVGVDGRVAFAHYNKDSGDNPPIEAVLDAMRS